MAPPSADNTTVSEGDEPEGTELAEPASVGHLRTAPVPHPSTLGWDEEEEPDGGPALASSPRSARLVTSDGVWEAVPEPEGSAGWEDDVVSAVASGGERLVWSELEDEQRLLPSGRRLVGRCASVRLVGQDSMPIPARLDTGRARSVLHAELLESGPETVRVRLGSRVLVLPRAASDALAVSVVLSLEGLELPVVLGVGDPWDGEPLVLGCDVLAGHFVVDPGRS
jgi:hypothetical protein